MIRDPNILFMLYPVLMTPKDIHCFNIQVEAQHSKNIPQFAFPKTATMLPTRIDEIGNPWKNEEDVHHPTDNEKLHFQNRF